jgi:hypothetical protein
MITFIREKRDLQEKRDRVCSIITSLFPIKIQYSTILFNGNVQQKESFILRVTWTIDKCFLFQLSNGESHVASYYDSLQITGFDQDWTLHLWRHHAPWWCPMFSNLDDSLENWIDNSRLSCLATWKHAVPILSQYLIPDVIEYVLKPYFISIK